MSERLSRRDMVLTLVGGIGTAALGRASSHATALSGTADVATDRRIAAATAVAEVIYPSAVDVEEAFVENQLFGRIEPRENHFRGLARAIDEVDGFCRAQLGAPVAELPPADRRRALDRMGIYEVHAAPDGTTAERIRHYLLNDLLYALFTHPKGGDLLGIANPRGYPGGNEVYRRGPSDER